VFALNIDAISRPGDGLEAAVAVARYTMTLSGTALLRQRSGRKGLPEGVTSPSHYDIVQALTRLPMMLNLKRGEHSR
jgi:hypothetical protein